MHVGRYKRLHSHPKGMEAFPRTCISICPRKFVYDFFKVEFPTGDMTVYAPSLSLSLSLSHTLPDRVEQSVARLTQEAETPGSNPVRPHTFVSPSTNSRRAVVSYWRKYVHEGLSLSRKSLVRFTNRSDMTIDVYRGQHTRTQYFLGGNLLYVSLHSRFPLHGKFSPGTPL